MSPKDQGTDSWTDRQTLASPTQTRATSKAAVNIVTMFEYIVLLLLQLILVCADALTHSQPASLEPVSVFEASTTRLIAHACVHLKRMHCNNDDDRDDDDNTTSSLINHNIVGRILV